MERVRRQTVHRERNHQKSGEMRRPGLVACKKAEMRSQCSCASGVMNVKVRVNVIVIVKCCFAILVKRVSRLAQ